MSEATAYYADKLELLRSLFGVAAVRLDGDRLRVGDTSYPILDDVILLDAGTPGAPDAASASEDIRFTFGAEWTEFPRVLPEHEAEFDAYFDLIDLETLRGARVADLGCGIGRWSYFLSRRCRELVLVDFSDAIFVARRNLAGCPGAVFFKGDVRNLPFRSDAFDLVVCLGVLHHLPTSALEATRSLARLAPRSLVYLYYALDNRPFYFRAILGSVTGLRRMLSRIRGSAPRRAITWAIACLVYLPMIGLGAVAARFGRPHWVPLYEFYRGMSLTRIRQDVYDRFFTRIEQRVTRRDIQGLSDTFRTIAISSRLPYWHFVCER